MALGSDRVCLLGPPSSGKTSLLFQQALDRARRGQSVLYVAQLPLETLPLLPPNDGPAADTPYPPAHLLRRIHFKYPANRKELLHLLSTLHTVGTYQSMIIDDLHRFISQTQVKGHAITSEVAQLCAYVVDAVDYMEQQSARSLTSESVEHSSIAVSLSTHTPNVDVMVDVIRRWIPNIFAISPRGPSEEREYVVIATSSGEKQLHYQLSQYLQLMPNIQ